jgi:hypothetical protein
MGSVTDWVANKIDPDQGLQVVGRTPEDFLILRYKSDEPFPTAVIGVDDVIEPAHVRPVLSLATKPEFVMNVPSKTIWSGAAIEMVHATPAAFGGMGDMFRAARGGHVPAYRNKELGFYEKAIRQHSNVRDVRRVYDHVFEAHRRNGDSLIIALVDGYHVSAEDVRNARDRYGRFDLAVKMTSYGSVTRQAEAAAESMGAEALTLKGLMRRLAK